MNAIWIPLVNDAAATTEPESEIDDALKSDAEFPGSHVWIELESPIDA